MSINYHQYKNRFFFFKFLMLLVWVGLVGRVFTIQIMDTQELSDKLMKAFKRKMDIPSERGNFFDRNGKQLTQNINYCSFAVHPAQVKSPHDLSKIFAKHFNKPKSYYLQKIKSKKKFIYLERHVPAEECQDLVGLNYSGYVVENSVNRYYPYGESIASLIGFVNNKNEGLCGLEEHYGHYLEGEDGWKTTARDARRKKRFVPGNFIKPSNGSDLHLSIDIDLQVILYDEIKLAVKKARAKKGMALLISPSSGEIISAVNYPSFDPNSGRVQDSQSLIMTPFSSSFEPGSTFKVVGATAVIEKDAVHPDDIFYCEDGKYILAHHTVRDWKPFNKLTFADVIANSSNIGVVKATSKLNDVDLYDASIAYGFSEPTGITFPGEASGSLKNYTEWTKISRDQISIGYEVAVTALQLSLAYGAIANGGYLMQPVLVKYIETPSGERSPVDKANVVRQVASPNTIRSIKKMLRHAVEAGTGKRANVPNMEISGKTGTAKKLQNGKYTSNYVTSFISFYPYEHPEYVLAVIIDDPHGTKRTGGSVAAPVARNIYTRMYNLYQPSKMVSVSKEQVQKPKETDYSIPVAAHNQMLSSTMFTPKKQTLSVDKMPDFKGKSLRSALQTSSRLGLNPEIHGTGRVYRQAPPKGAHLTSKSKVVLYLRKQ